MDFEFDAAKSVANLSKHGIDFTGAQALWSDHDPFITMRDGRVRIISVRRARDEEKAAYFEDQGASGR